MTQYLSNVLGKVRERCQAGDGERLATANSDERGQLKALQLSVALFEMTQRNKRASYNFLCKL